jgi:hypothetical protein
MKLKSVALNSKSQAYENAVVKAMQRQIEIQEELNKLRSEPGDHDKEIKKLQDEDSQLNKNIKSYETASSTFRANAVKNNQEIQAMNTSEYYSKQMDQYKTFLRDISKKRDEYEAGSERWNFYNDQIKQANAAFKYANLKYNEIKKLEAAAKNTNKDKPTTPTVDADAEYKKQLAAKEKDYKESQLELLEQLRKGELSEENYNKIALQTQLGFLEDKQKLQKKYGQETIDTEIEISNQKLKIQKEGEDSVLKSLQEAHKAELQTLDTEEKTKLLQIKDDYLNGIIPTREEYEQAIEDLEFRSLEKRLTAQRNYLALLKKITNPTKEQAAEIASAEAGIIATETSINDKRIKGEEKYQKDKKKLVSKYSKDTILGAYEIEKAELDRQRKEGLISEAEYQQELLKSKLGAASKYVQQVQQITQAGSEFVGALKDAETSKSQAANEKELGSLTELYNSKQITEEEYNKRKEKLQYDQAVKELDIQKKYADAEFAMKVANIGAATAMGIINAWASSMTLGPIAGPIAAGIMTALLVGTAGAQISAANSERERIKAMTIESPASGTSTSQSTGARVVNQAADGRWDVIGEQDGKTYRNVRYAGRARTGYVTTPTLMGESGTELIIDAPTLRRINTTAPQVLDIIRNNRVVPQRADGSYGALGGSASASVTDNSGLIAANLAVMDRVAGLLQWLQENKIEADVSLTKFEQKRDLRDKSLAKGSLKG